MTQQQINARPLDVSRLDVDQRTGPASVTGQAGRSRRRKSEVDKGDYPRFAVRTIRARGRRIAAGDVEDLADLLALADELNRNPDGPSVNYEHAATHGQRSPLGSAPAVRQRSSGEEIEATVTPN